MVPCGFRDQIEVLSKLQSFEVDMSYKRIRSKSMNEVLFTTFLQMSVKVSACQLLASQLLTSL